MRGSGPIRRLLTRERRHGGRCKAAFRAFVIAVCAFRGTFVLALDSGETAGRYSRTTWKQKDGLPQDTVRRIVQTTDGYLWVGTDEGLARFDGYDFTIYNKDTGELPSNVVTALAAGTDGSLWIGTTAGAVGYRDKTFHTYTARDGLPVNMINDVYVDRSGTAWVVAGGVLSRFDGKRMTPFGGKELPFTVFTVCEDRHKVLWVAGFSGLARWDGGKFVQVIDSATMDGNLITAMVVDGDDNIWLGGPRGVVRRAAGGVVRKFDTTDGLPHIFVRSLALDHSGAVWAGTNAGFARLRNGRFAPLDGPEGRDRDSVWCLYEDREGNMWTGAINGLSRFRHDAFTAYGESEGLPGDDPVAVHQDRQGRIWVGYHNNGLALFSSGGRHQTFSSRDGLPSNEIFSIRDSRDGTLLLGTRGGLVRVQGTQFHTFSPKDQLGRSIVLDALEDSKGRLWLALPSGLAELRAGTLRMELPASGSLLDSWMVSLLEGSDRTLWVGTYSKGLWRIQGGEKRQFTTADGLSSNQIRSLHEDRDGTLWIATFGGGLNAFRNGRFTAFTAKDGLLSDNVSNIVDDGEALWLGTTRGICRISKKQLGDFSEHEIRILQPTNYGVEDGLGSAQSAPAYPVAAGGTRTADGRLWFPTSQGLAVLNPIAPQEPRTAPSIQFLELVVDGKAVDFSRAGRLPPGSERVQLRYTAIHLTAPERVQYSHRLEGLDADWVAAGRRREINYNSLGHGKYRFLVRAEIPGAPVTEASYAFEILPRFYEAAWFRLLTVLALLTGAWGAYQLRVRQIRYRFALMLQERARLAREIHDTLAQSFVGISSQLEVVASELPPERTAARMHLDMARKMARHSITEARRSIVDLRASALEGQNLADALRSGAQVWTAGSGLGVDVDAPPSDAIFPDEVEQHLLRIAQEAVSNVMKHAKANRIWIHLSAEARVVSLAVRDDGRGFDLHDTFSPEEGHFGLIGMRERAERLGGEFRLTSKSGQGTQVEVTVPLS